MAKICKSPSLSWNLFSNTSVDLSTRHFKDDADMDLVAFLRSYFSLSEPGSDVFFP